MLVYEVILGLVKPFSEYIVVFIDQRHYPREQIHSLLVICLLLARVT